MMHSILIIDDETNVRLMLRTALKSVGYHVTEASNGREGLEAIRRSLPDVVILDLSMPVLDGMGVLQELTTFPVDRKPRVIVLTAYGSISTAVKATRLGAIDFLEKPASPEEVRESVESALSEHPPVLFTSVPVDPLSGGYEAVLDRIRKALRMTKYTDAQTLLMKAADLAMNDAAYFNLLGVLYESQRQWKLAKKMYGKAIKTNKQYDPAQKNMRRIYELYTFGKCAQAVVLGDEKDDVLYARLPEVKH